ncbi:hypothetical protein SAMN05216326_12733 [Nitrosomonas marina]|uniref:DUF4376 domain-containing protein n=1 Tax=Nitrosomonas marina TaxID=917 RepID=A0A1I0EIH1_9PROT|nr:hypothetical protein [Nitrosomonas marina]SET44437.1 hypothetical protein SAMN05216326_12733 [Nitrosomonas marina]
MTINYTEKGNGLHREISMAGHSLKQINGEWVSDDDVAVQSIIDGYPLSLTIAEFKRKVDAYAATLRNKAVDGVSPGEMASWPAKKAEAESYNLTLDPADAPTLNVEATARGVPLQSIVNRVIANSAALTGLEAQIAGVAGMHKDAIEAMQDFSAIVSYNYKTGWPNV